MIRILLLIAIIFILYFISSKISDENYFIKNTLKIVMIFLMIIFLVVLYFTIDEYLPLSF